MRRAAIVVMGAVLALCAAAPIGHGAFLDAQDSDVSALDAPWLLPPHVLGALVAAAAITAHGRTHAIVTKILRVLAIATALAITFAAATCWLATDHPITAVAAVALVFASAAHLARSPATSAVAWFGLLGFGPFAVLSSGWRLAPGAYVALAAAIGLAISTRCVRRGVSRPCPAGRA